mgnify:FL=1
MKKTVFKNALLVTPESVTEGDLACSDGVITGVGGSCGAEGADVVDCEGAWLIPGLVELHTDNLERYMIPRPKVVWPEALPAFFAHDAQIAASGITTVFDAMAVGEYFNKGRIAMLARSVDALERARRSGYLRADHFLHLRCELADPRLASLFPEVSGCPALRLLSLMDNTPGDRQWRDLGSWRTHYSDIKNWKDDAGFAQDIRALKAQRDACFDENLAMVLGFAKKHGIPLASHDDTTAEQVDAAVRDGVVICESPTTMEAARRAAERGLMVTLGAPNIVRGQSSTKNVSAMDVAEAGCLSCLSSDYVPASLLEAVFILMDRGVMSLPEAMRLVTLNPARTAGLTDRGALKEGLRADLCLVTLCGSSPIVRGVWKAGTRVF